MQINLSNYEKSFSVHPIIRVLPLLQAVSTSRHGPTSVTPLARRTSANGLPIIRVLHTKATAHVHGLSWDILTTGITMLIPKASQNILPRQVHWPSSRAVMDPGPSSVTLNSIPYCTISVDMTNVATVHMAFVRSIVTAGNTAASSQVTAVP